MKKRKVNALLAIVLSLTMMVGVAGCGKKQQLEAEIDPGTPVSEVQFPLKETAELSFITSLSCGHFITNAFLQYRPQIRE